LRNKPALGGNVAQVIVRGNAYYGGEIVTESEYEALKGAKDTGGSQLLLKGKEVK